MLKKILSFIGNRAKERSTWVGLLMIAGTLGLDISPELQEQIIKYGIIVGGFILVLSKDI
jgi:hypothetical protein